MIDIPPPAVVFVLATPACQSDAALDRGTCAAELRAAVRAARAEHDPSPWRRAIERKMHP